MMDIPVVIFLYNRPELTRQTLDAIALNNGAASTKFFIFIDGPKPGVTAPELKKLEQVREIAREWASGKDAEIFISERNKGLANSIQSGLTDLFRTHEKLIVLEDDIVTGPGFLDFMNNALNYYETNGKLAGVSGFSYPAMVPVNEIFFLPNGSSWGWGTWKRVWEKVNWDAEDLLENLLRSGRQQELNFGEIDYLGMLRNQVEGRIDSWAIRFYVSFFLNNQYFAFSPRNQVKNIGWGAHGTHTKDADYYIPKMRIETNPAFAFRGPVLDEITDSVNRFLTEENRFKPRIPRRFYLRAFDWLKERLKLHN